MAKKKSSEKPFDLIKVFPIIKLEVKTPKGKKFDLYSIGIKSRFFVIDEGF